LLLLLLRHRHLVCCFGFCYIIITITIIHS